MTERERWVVYPLLFLALGAALRDKLVDRTVAKNIVCEELTIVSDDTGGHTPLARFGHTDAANSSTAYLLVNGDVQLNGTVHVNGALSAQQYVGVPAVIAVPAPTFDILRGMQPPPDQQLNPGNKKPSGKQPSPPNKSQATDRDSLSSPSKSKAAGKSTPDK